MTRVRVNGEERLLAGAYDLAAVVASVVGGCSVDGADEGGSQPTGVAAAVNDRVVPRSRWASVRLQEDDRIEIVSAVQGG